MLKVKHDIKILNLVDKLQANNIALKIYIPKIILFIGIRQNSYQNVAKRFIQLESSKESNIMITKK